ncbi:MAG: filamentous hemagglutinin N-terminal domain-containing protein, partial [Planctomycetaceae bacterium]|nr:filamentous hemagglutinin N-terminal domain-containing protein [Planctomycetaceae bacterium]
MSRLLNLFLVSLIITQPYQAMAGGITPDSQAASGNQPRMDQAANGVPVIDIAPATAAGVSHNQYRDFNVTSQGVILNNATGMSKTQLGGYIQANDRLKGRPARLILNEVTSANPSHLNGYMEIGGHGAEVVVANPNGISCNGCGFINTPQATLTTGIPQLSGGRLDAFAVDGGEVRIEGEGINAANIDKLSIISRAVVLNAKINARDLTLISGKNRVDATTHSILSSGTDGDAPTLSLDSSALGGMYANSIRLVGTEHGVGVHL